MNRSQRRAKEAMLRGPVRRYEDSLRRGVEAGLVVPRLFEEGGIVDAKSHTPEEMKRRGALTMEAGRVIASKELQDWLEALAMSTLEELQRDPVFIEDLKDILRDSIKAALRSKDFREHIVAQCREATSSVAIDEIAGHEPVITRAVKEMLDAELRPALERTLRAEIDRHVGDVKRKLGF